MIGRLARSRQSRRCVARAVGSGGRARTLLAAILIAFAAAQSPAHAGEEPASAAYPSRTVRILTGNQAGTVSDLAARVIGEKLEELWGTPVVVENRSGAGGTIAAEAVSKSPGDGYTLLVAGQSNLVLAQAVGRDLHYDPRQDLAPIGLIARVPFALAANRKTPFASVPELVTYARAHPGELTYASGGPGTLSQLSVELFSAATGAAMLDVPYKGVSSAMTDVVAGRVDVILTDYVTLAPHLKSGALRLLGAAGARRMSAAPGVPTLAEQGVAGYAVGGWYGLLAPATTPPDVLAKLRSALNQTLRMPDVRQRLEQGGCEPSEESLAQFRALMAEELEKYTEIARRAGIRAD
jgi:tripartite-type tricarboxylate transporter receptor subunit TctC